jgi:tetratricopeptide (TPR) repeat protein
MSAGRGRRGQPDKMGLADVLGEIGSDVRELVDGEDYEAALTKAAVAHEEYDYELARSLYRLAVLYSRGAAEVVCRLATFLVDDYAILDEAIRVLESGACEDSLEGRRLLAKAYGLAGDASGALTALRAINDEGHGDSETWARQGGLLLEAGDMRLAQEALQEALSLDARNGEATSLLARCRELMANSIAPLLDDAKGALEEGHIERADGLLKEAADSPYLPSRYHRLRAETDKRLGETKLEGLLDEASGCEAAGDEDAALSGYRQALALEPSCEIAAEKVGELEARLARNAGLTWLGRGDTALGAGNFDDAVHGYYMAVTRDHGLAASGGDGEVLFELVREFREDVGKVPDRAQAAALSALYRAHHELQRENLPGSQLEVRRAGGLAESLPTGRSIGNRLKNLREAEGHERAKEWLAEAEGMEKAGNVDKAIALYERVARVKGLAEAAECAQRARELRASLSTGRQRGNALASLDLLVAEQQFFLALRDLEKSRTLLAGEPRLAELEEAATQGTRDKFPMDVQVLAPSMDGKSSFQTELGVEFLPTTSRLMQAAPGSSEYFLVSGRKLQVLDSAELRCKLTVELPPQADLTDKKGFFLSDIVPGERAGLVTVNFDDDLLLYFQYRRSQFELVNVLPLKRFLQQSRRKVTRWYTLNGPEEQLVVCQSPHGGGGETRIYGLSLLDGRLEYDDEFGYALSNLRRIPGGEARYVIHRMPEPMLMKRPGYFSLMFMDGRLRVQGRLNIGPEDLEGTFIESTRWFRIGPQSGTRFFFFRYFDSYTGQLVSHPLAFVAMKASGDLAYAATDSSILVRNEGDLEAIGEIFLHDGREVMAMLGRKESEPLLFVIDLDNFRVLKKHVLARGRRYVGMASTEVAGKVVLFSLHSEDGDARMETMEVL